MAEGWWEWRGKPFDWLWFCDHCPGSPAGNRKEISVCKCGDRRPSLKALDTMARLQEELTRLSEAQQTREAVRAETKEACANLCDGRALAFHERANRIEKEPPLVANPIVHELVRGLRDHALEAEWIAEAIREMGDEGG